MLRTLWPPMLLRGSQPFFYVRRAIATQATPLGKRTPREQRLVELSLEAVSKGTEYVKSCKSLRTLPEGPLSYAEVALVGEANGGRTSLLRAITGGIKFGQVSTRPGTTQTLDFFRVGDAFTIVDTPGLGFWEPGLSRRKRTKRHALEAHGHAATLQYLSCRKHANLRHVYWVIAANKPELSVADRFLAQFLHKERIPYTIVLSKIDRALEQPKLRWRQARGLTPDSAHLHPNHHGGAGAVESSPGEQRKQRLLRTTYTSVETRVASLLQPLLDPESTFVLRSPLAASMENGSSWVPPSVIDTSTVRNSARHHTDLLVTDMVHRCTEHLPIERLTLEAMRDISYAPASAAFQIAVEERLSLALASDFCTAYEDYLACASLGRPVPLKVARTLGLEATGTPLLDGPSEAGSFQLGLSLPVAGALPPIPAPSDPDPAVGQLTSTTAATLPLIKSSCGGAAGGPSAVDASKAIDLVDQRDQRKVGQNSAVIAPAVDTSPRAFNAFLAEGLERLADARGDVFDASSSYSTLPASVQIREMEFGRSQTRFDAIVDSQRAQVVQDEKLFHDEPNVNSASYLSTQKKRDRRKILKYIDMRQRQETTWKTDAAAHLMPFADPNRRASVAGIDGVLETGSTNEARHLGAGFQMDGLRSNRKLFKCAPNTGKKVQKLHKWKRTVDPSS